MNISIKKIPLSRRGLQLGYYIPPKTISIASVLERPKRLIGKLYFKNPEGKYKLIKLGMNQTSALGLPDRKNFEPTPEIKVTDPKEWEIGIQEHDAERAGKHYDLRLADPETGKAYSWALRNLPRPGKRVLAKQQPLHTRDYLSFEGTIPEGYGAGTVMKKLHGLVEVLKSEPNKKVSFVHHTGHKSDRYTLINPKNMGDDQDWLLINHTPTKDTRPIPLSKPSMKEGSLEDLDPSDDRTWTPKIDGAHTLIDLRAEKPIDVFSYRESKRGNHLIDYTYKTDLYKSIAPKEIGKRTLLRGEIFAQNEEGKTLPSTDTAAMLNAGVYKSRELQKEKGNLTHRIFDIDVYKGKDVSMLPYKQKLTFLDAIEKNVPEIMLIPRKVTTVQKEGLLNEIKSSSNPLTDEGIVAYDQEESIGMKYKKKKDTEVYIREFFEGKGRLTGTGIGGFYASIDPNGSPDIRVGSGLNDEIRRDMRANPDKYIGKKAKITYMELLPSGKFRMPIFKEMRSMV